MSVRTPFHRLPYPTQAGIAANDSKFGAFVWHRLGDGTEGRASPSAAAEFIRRHCQVSSRRDLGTDRAARDRFDALRADFDAWCGRAAAPR